MKLELELTDGYIITTTSQTFGKLVLHQGMFFHGEGLRPYVVHCTPGEGVVVDHWTDFVYNRKLIALKATGLSRFEIKRRIEPLLEKDYDLLSYNCFEFIDSIVEQLPVT